jgi:pSer/pThr/pTyr-binding forkhead associated (FHA) protein
MAEITIRVLEGLERGRLYARLPTPVTIGREDDNDIQLNDDRVSRFHAKLQMDGGKIILTDLDSTNGTRVNGHPIQMRVIQAGDVLSIGRCLLQVGDVRLGNSTGDAKSADAMESSTAHFGAEPRDVDADDVDFLSPPTAYNPEEGELFPAGAPEPPMDLRPLQRAQLSDMLAYFHEQVGDVVKHSVEDTDRRSGARVMRCDWTHWRRLVDLHAELARYLHQIANPER